MKNIIISILLLFSLFANAQNDTIKSLEQYKNEINGIRYCNYMFAKENLTAIGFGIGGSILISLTLNSKDINNTNRGALVVGTASCLIGAILEIDSFKWMRRAGLSPADYGFGFKVDLDSKRQKKSEKTYTKRWRDDIYN